MPYTGERQPVQNQEALEHSVHRADRIAQYLIAR